MNEKEKAVRTMQNYINDHLHNPITLKQISDSCHLSPSYGAKIFKEATGYSLYKYIQRLRLSQAAKRLRDENLKVIDVAFDFVFDSHEGFTRAFSKEFGLPPKDYATTNPPIKWFLPYMVEPEQKEAFTVNSFIFTQVIERPKRKLLIKRGVTATDYFKYCDEVGCDVWGILMSVKEALYEPAGFWLPKSLIKPGTSQYAQGVEVPLDYSNLIPEGFDLIELPESLVLIFQGQTYDESVWETSVSHTMEAIKEFKPELYGYTYDFDSTPRFQLEPRGERGYIEGWPIKKLIDG